MIKKFYLLSSVTLVYLLFPCLLVEETVALWGINVDIFKSILFFNLFIVFLLYGNKKFSKSFIVVICLYFLILFYLILISALSSNPTVAFRALFRHRIKDVIVFLFLCSILSSKKMSIDLYIKSIIYIALAFSVLTTIMMTIYFYDKSYLNFQEVFLLKYKQVAIKVGVFGYFNYQKRPFPYNLRVQSYFTEPARYAHFLLFPFFASLGYYKLTRKKIYIAFALLMILNIFLTFAIASYLIVILSVLIYIIVKKYSQYKEAFTRAVHFLFYSLVSLLLFTLILSFFMSHDWTENTWVPLGRKSSLESRISCAVEKLSMAINQPFGDALYFAKIESGPPIYRNTTFSLIDFMLYGGSLGLVLLVYILYKYFKIIRKNLLSKYGYFFLGALSVLLAKLSFGTLFSFHFMFIFALALALNDKIKFSRPVAHNNMLLHPRDNI